jgi:hypothetical protein
MCRFGSVFLRFRHRGFLGIFVFCGAGVRLGNGGVARWNLMVPPDGKALAPQRLGESSAFALSSRALLFVVALLVAAARGRHGPVAERFLSWILLLPIGITGLWAGAFHVFFPATAAKLIGWEVSPFQFEVGMADLATLASPFGATWASRRRP